jgi:sulfite exporter TauE/SafE
LIELPLIFVSGMLGSAHCLGMCGPLALSLGSTASDWSGALLKQIAYTAGRVFTYGVLGSASGFCGARIVETLPTLVNIPASLAIVAGLMLIVQGLKATGLFRRQGVGSAPCLAGGILSHFLRLQSAGAAFLAGLFTGFLPCGLLYGMLALAMSTHSLAWGGLTMIVFGLGTAPGMIAIGTSGRLVSLAARRRLLAAAAWCLVLTGVVSTVRGVSFVTVADKPAAGCPMCRP